MLDELLEDFHGPGKLRVFSLLLTIVVCLAVIGVILAQLYDFPLLRDLVWVFVEDPMLLLPIAGIISLGGLAFSAWAYFDQFQR